MLYFRAINVRRLFAADSSTRDAPRSTPQTKEILAALSNTHQYNSGIFANARTRVRLGQELFDWSGTLAGYIGVCLVQNAQPTLHEHLFVWGEKPPEVVSGVFIQRLLVKSEKRCFGFGSILLDQAKRLAIQNTLRVYCDVASQDMRMRSFLHKAGYTTNIFWLTQKKTVMVRYML